MGKLLTILSLLLLAIPAKSGELYEIYINNSKDIETLNLLDITPVLSTPSGYIIIDESNILINSDYNLSIKLIAEGVFKRELTLQTESGI